MTALTAFGLLLVSLAFQEVPKDTSYTLHSAYLKIRKNYPEITIPTMDSREVAIQSNLVYKTVGKRPLRCNIYLPNQSRKVAVMLIHGGGWRTGDKLLMKNLAIRLASEGYLVMTPEYRLSIEASYPAAVYDLKDGIRWIREHASDFEIDAEKLVVAGCSAGGQLAALVGATGDDFLVEEGSTGSCKVNAIIDIDGVLAFRHPDSQESMMAAEWLGGSASEIPEIWDQASALTYAGKNTPPTLFLASKYPRFLAGKENYSEILELNSILVQTRFMGDVPHSFWLFNPWFEPTVAYMVEFLDRVFSK